jgi:hypothetical protein
MPLSSRPAVRVAVLALALTAVFTGPLDSLTRVPSAHAAPTTGDPIALISSVAPELLTETRTPASEAERSAIRAQGGGTAFDAAIPSDPAAAIRLTPTETEGAGLPVGITIEGASGRAAVSQGITVYAGDDDSAAYVQPVENGVRLLTALAGSSAGDSFSYRFELPAGSYTTELPSGETLVSDASHHYVGTVAAPWARDASGAELPTHYSWSGDTLTQHVELGEQTAYPVLLDPLWLYSYDFSVVSTGFDVRSPRASEAAVDRLLHSCFNCYFPIAGASRLYPVAGGTMNLNASPFTVITIPAPVRTQFANGGALQFVALSGHFDGAGSTITFSWYNDPSGYIHLYVHAMIMQDRGPAINVANSRAAGVTWLGYWRKVADNASGSGGGV